MYAVDVGEGWGAREKAADHQERTGEEEKEREDGSQSASPLSHLRFSGVLAGWVAPVDDFIISARAHTPSRTLIKPGIQQSAGCYGNQPLTTDH